MSEPRRALSEAEIEARVIQIHAALEAGGYNAPEAGLEAARRILRGEITGEEARAEIVARYLEAE